MKKTITILSLLATVVLFPFFSSGNDIETVRKTGCAFTEIAKKTIPAVVSIKCERIVRLAPSRRRGMDADLFEWLFRGQGMEVPRGQIEQGGTGFIISKDGYILTNNHVVGDADKITVVLNDGRHFEAKRIGSDPRSEVAVIKIEASDLPILELGDSASLEIGEWVIAIGNQFGHFSESLTVGVVSAKGRSNLDLALYEDYIQTDAAINPGNSGGPLLNIDGKVIGINTAIVSQSGGYMGIGLAIPINMAKIIKDQLIKTGKVIRGYLGVRFNPRDIDEAMAESFGLKKARGALIAEVVPNSPAEVAGIKPGDIILSVNGKEISDTRNLMSTIALMAPGSNAALKVFRNGESINVGITIGIYPDDDVSNVAESTNMSSQFGLAVVDITPEISKRFGLGVVEGVIISDVEEGGPAAMEGLEPGLLVVSVNKQLVRNKADFEKALKESANSKRALMRIKNSDMTWFVLLRLDR